MTAPPTVKLTKAQKQALLMLSHRACYTASSTYGDMSIAGTAAKALVERGLAKYVRGYQVGIPGSTVVQITELGQQVFPHDRHDCPCGHPRGTQGVCGGCNCADGAP